MDPFILEQKEYFILNDWVQRFPEVTVGFTTKNGGFSSGNYSSLNVGYHVDDKNDVVSENRRKIASKLHIPLVSWVGAQQTHEIRIKKVTGTDKGKGAIDYSSALTNTDGLFTNEVGILLSLNYADCVPIFFMHPRSKFIGIAHAGWRGTVQGIAREMITCFQSEGIEANEILVAIGPSICENCYIVDENVIKLVEKILEDVERKPYNLISDNQYKLNLKECNKKILLQAGVLDKHIFITNLCTSCQKDVFFSHRRDHGKTGRMMGFIGWKEASLN